MTSQTKQWMAEGAMKTVLVAMQITWPVLLGVSGWAFMTLMDHESRIVRIESTRYTRESASVDRAKLETEIDILHNSVSTIDRIVAVNLNRMENIEKLLMEIRIDVRAESEASANYRASARARDEAKKQQ